MSTQIPDIHYFGENSSTPPEWGITPAPSNQQQILGDAFAKTAEKTEEEPEVSGSSPESLLIGKAFWLVNTAVDEVLKQ